MKIQVNIKHGESYGFPKTIPERLHTENQTSPHLKTWFLEQGYPEKLYEQNKWTITSQKV